MESATENNRHIIVVRMKTGGKSTRSMLAIVLMGKPYREQGKIGTCW